MANKFFGRRAHNYTGYVIAGVVGFVGLFNALTGAESSGDDQMSLKSDTEVADVANKGEPIETPQIDVSLDPS